MHATARVTAVIAGAEEANTAEYVTVEGDTVRWTVRRVGAEKRYPTTAETRVEVTDAAVAEFVTELLAARLRVTACGRGRSRSGS